ncbi:TIGR02678 family protein [Streptomyces sp. CA-278952]|uniref:TIGR02678 family protein n=1 Tax=Streptomyces sp. CA-278952 TaxID=2980556 RepID=UPI0023683D86|nr:TIGR02678 family protein [Streptomyces sp. CA-278952]WDG29757.1 TIGR02678 family protein [Streptomyces sp. CA-278952]
MTLPSAHDVSLATERRTAARLLLAHPLVTSDGPHADLFPLVRRHADWLVGRFQQVLGYRLLVDSSYARLFKAGLGARSGHRLVRSTGTPFTPHTYACLALALSVLVTAPEQLLLSQLVADIRAAAADADVELEETGRASGKRTLVAALRQLVQWGVLIETHGHVGVIAQEADGEALITVDRELARVVVAGPLAQSRDGADLVRRAADPGFGGPRTYVRRMLVETPVVHLDELTDTERDWLRTRQRREAHAFLELLSLETEIRAEGVALVDPEGELTDLHLPGTGTVAQASLLLVERLVERLGPAEPGHPATGGVLVVGVAVPDGAVDELLAELVAGYGQRSGWQRGYLEDPDALREAVLDLLSRMRHREEVSDSLLLKRHTALRDQLAGGYDAQLDEHDGVKVCRLLDDHGSHDVAVVGERIAAEAAAARGRLTERESDVFQRFLTGELGDHLSAQVITATHLVAALNDTLKTVRTSHGLGVELVWKLNEDADADVRVAVELLRSPSSLRTREQTEQLRDVTQRRIEDARRADPSAGYTAHLRTALDYRSWFTFHTFVVEDAAPGRRRKLTGRTGLSQGEQRVLSYLVLFAAASAHFTSLADSAPHAPRLILLDDAFAKVDEPTHGRLGRILVDLDLDFVLTSERLMGNWAEVPSLHIYECLRDPHVRGVATLHYTWNGRHRRLASA